MALAPDHQLRPLLNLEEVCALLGLSRRTVRRYEEAGHLRAVKLSPQTTRYRPEDIEDFLDAHRTPVERVASTQAGRT